MRIRLVPPLGYLDFLRLMSEAKIVLTDSGGIQEATTILGAGGCGLESESEELSQRTESECQPRGGIDLQALSLDKFLRKFQRALNIPSPGTLYI
jgi:UDP-N-acetylglucosamine 2-epimerase